MLRIKTLFVLLFLSHQSLIVGQNLQLPRIFGDHMVLQRGQDVRIWGWAEPGQSITVTINQVSVSAVTDEKGKWGCQYPAHAAGGPFEMVVSGKEELHFADVWFGDVWIAGGQSNMEWDLKSEVDNWEAEVAASDYPKIRFFDVANEVAFEPQDNLNSGEWQLASPETSPDFSAVAWFFARRNHLEKDVPVGIIESNWGGTPAEAWTSSEMLLTLEAYQEATQEMMDPSIDWKTKMEENEQNNQEKFRVINSKAYLDKDVYKPSFDDGSWEVINLPSEQVFEHVVWLRKKFDWDGSKRNVKLSIGRLTINQNIFINGEEIEDVSQGTIIDVPNGMLKNKDNVIAVRLVNAWNNRLSIEPGRELWLDDGDIDLDLSGEWKFSNEVEDKIPDVVRFSHLPATLYNGMIRPIEGYTIRGAIWYQGESNTGQAGNYEALFSSMINDWRIRWQQGDFPFLFVQLANFMARSDQPTDTNWARLRDAQTQTLKLPNTGMALAIDIGNEVDIHPRNKQDVGKRLWLAAKKVVFKEDIVYSGPSYKAHTVDDGQIVVTFENVGSGLMAAGPEITGFAIAGEDKAYYWAEGKIDSNKIILSAPGVSNPIHVRYAWADNPACNIYNKEGLPAVPFRTDDWKQE